MISPMGNVSYSHGRGFAIWLLPIFVFLIQQQQSDCRYLPTRSHADSLDKLRELMVQILESSKEDTQPLQQSLRAPNDAYNTQREAWLNKLNPSEILTASNHNFGSNGLFGSGRYY